MAEQIIPLVWPFSGLSETLAFSKQEHGTAREYQNVRGLDPKTGRLRGGQRSGLSKYMPAALKISGTKVQDLTAFFQDNRQVTYSAIASGSETTTWSTATPSETACSNVKVDRQGNVYAVDGNAGLVKYSSDGRKLWRIALPTDDTNHVVRALAVDDGDIVYVGVSSGGLQEKAKLFAYEQLSDNKTELLWELKPGAYIEDMILAHSKLYTCQNRPDTKTALVRIYEFQDTTRVRMTKEWQVPYPVNSIAVKADASVVVACERTVTQALDAGDITNYFRDPDPRFPAFSVASEDWTPRQLVDYDKRVWAWYVADDIDETDVASDFVDGVEVTRWRDRTKNGRHLIAPKDEGDGGPKLALNAMPGSRKALRFSARGTTSPLQSLKSLDNGSTVEAFKQNQKTAIPGYEDSAWATFIVCRPSDTLPFGDNTPRWVFGQDRDNQGNNSDDHILFINATGTSIDNLPPASSSGSIFWFTGQVAQIIGGDGASGTIRSGSFVSLPPSGTPVRDNPGNFVIIAMVSDGGAVGAHFSLFEINGHPIDRFLQGEQRTIYRTQYGIYRVASNNDLQPTSGVSGFLGDIYEILSIDKDDSRSPFGEPDSVILSDELEYNSSAQSQTINEMTKIVGYLAHRYGAQLNLPFGTAATNNYPHPFGLTGTGTDVLSGPPNNAGNAVSTAQALANKAFGAVVKYNSEGKIQWCANEMATGDGSRPGGFGYAVAVNSDGNIYSLGPNPTVSGGVQQVRMIVDQGTTFSIDSADGAWSAVFPSNAEQDYHYPRVAVDSFDNLYIPYNDTADAASFRVYRKTGTVLHSKALTSPQKGRAVAISATVPDYRTDLSASVNRAEHVIVAGEAATTGDPTVAKVRLVSAAQSGAAPRTLVNVGVSGGDIVKFTTAGTSAITNGTGALDSSSYVQSTALFKKVYWTDGRQYKQYSVVTNEITSYVSTSAGEIPARCSLIESWRGRIVLARSADDPHAWHLSKKDDPDNWDFFPPTPTEADAVAGANSPAGLCPDIINTCIPYSEDVLVFGGDHSIWALIGDPAAGGRLELVSDITGMAFGRPWTKDPNGVLYFFGSQGGLYRWQFGTPPQRISLSRIERQLQDVDLSTHFIRLVYNHRDEGIHIFQCPFGAGATQVSHWFYEIKTNSFAKDVFGTSSFTNVQPTAAMVIDGDEFEDRTILLGGEDGFVRKWDMDAKSDDTRTDGSTYHAIDSYVTMFPLPGIEDATALETQFSGLTVVLAEDQSGCRYELFSSEAPETLGQPRRQGELTQGRNPPKWDRVVGPYCGLRLRNGAREQRWAFERGHIRASVAGLARPRS